MRRRQVGRRGRSQRVFRPETLESRQLLALVIAEINYEPYGPAPQFGETGESANDFEFIELLNSGNQPVNLQGMRFIQQSVGGTQEGINFNFGADVLAPNERIVVVRDLRAFGSRYGTNIRVAGEWSGGGLSNSGELLTLVNPAGGIVVQMAYDSNADWPTRAAGVGATLEIKDVMVDPNDPDNWRSSREYGGTPGTASQASRDPTVLINEVLAHTDAPQRDTVEFYNLTDAAIDMSGWYFADDSGSPFRFRLPPGSIIPAKGYLTIDERNFNPGGGDLPNDFAISELGEPLKLISASTNGRPRLLEDYVIVGPTANGVSVGNVMNLRGGSELVTLAGLTFGAANGGHRVAEVVVSEIQYHTPDDDVYKEFVELQNTTSTDVVLDHWGIEDALDVSVPIGTILKGGESVVLVAFNPALDQARAAAFRAYYEIDATVRLIGPWGTNNSGAPQNLSNNGEMLTLRNPLVDAGEVFLALADQVNYDDAVPWPLVADGGGASLSRPDLTKFGNQAESWQPARPSPGNLPIDYSTSPPLELDVPLSADLGRDGQMLRGTTDVDVFRFQAAANGNYVFRTQAVGAAALTAIRVFTTDQEEIAFNNHPTGSTENRVSVALQASNEYYVVVSGRSDAAQNYNPFTGAVLVPSAASGAYTLTVQLDAVVGAPWQNAAWPTDVNDSGSVDPIDALLIINELNSHDSSSQDNIVLPPPGPANEPPPFLDVNGDGFLSPLDALLVINALNDAANAAARAAIGASAEGEPSDARGSTVAAEPVALPFAAAAIDHTFALSDLLHDGADKRKRRA